jgi:hypothetical protein
LSLLQAHFPSLHVHFSPQHVEHLHESLPQAHFSPLHVHFSPQQDAHFPPQHAHLSTAASATGAGWAA